MAKKVKKFFVLIVLLSAVCILFLKMLFFSNYWSKFSVTLGRNNVTCKRGLLQVAHDMLNGELMPLPFHNKTTRWKFKERVPMSEMFIKRRAYTLLLNDSTILNGSAKEEYRKTKKHFITFAHNCCEKSKSRAVSSALTKGGFDNARFFNMSDLSSKFRQTHKVILRGTPGAGYWLWKPYILLKVLLENDVAYGDFVMYQDADSYIFRSAEPWLQDIYQTKTGIGVFIYSYREGSVTKRDTLILMDMDLPQVRVSEQLMGGYLVARKNCAAIQFVMEWLAYLSDAQIATDQNNTMGLPNYPEFKYHRHDQSVLSLLAKRWGLPVWTMPWPFSAENEKKTFIKHRRKY